MFSESSTGRWVVLQLLCCPSKQGKLSENILQNLFFHNLTPQTVVLLQSSCSMRERLKLACHALLTCQLVITPKLPCWIDWTWDVDALLVTKSSKAPLISAFRLSVCPSVRDDGGRSCGQLRRRHGYRAIVSADVISLR